MRLKVPLKLIGPSEGPPGRENIETLRDQEPAQAETLSRADLDQRTLPAPQTDLGPNCLRSNPDSTTHGCVTSGTFLSPVTLRLAFPIAEGG